MNPELPGEPRSFHEDGQRPQRRELARDSDQAEHDSGVKANSIPG